MMDGKTRLRHVERLTEINCEKLHLVGCTLRIYLAMDGPINVTFSVMIFTRFI